MKRSLCAAAFLAIFASSANAVTLIVEATSIGHSYAPSARSTVDWILGSHWGAATVPTFTTNLSQTGIFSLSVVAPPDQDFVVTGAPGSIGMVMSIGSPLSMWLGSGWNGGLRDYAPTTVSFGGYSGSTWYNDTTGVSIDQQGLAIMAEGSLWWSGAVNLRFHSVTVAADLSSFVSRSFPTATFRPDLSDGIRFQNVLAATNVGDPGAAVSFMAATPVPEPTTLALLLCGVPIALCTARSRRRAGRE